MLSVILIFFMIIYTKGNIVLGYFNISSEYYIIILMASIGQLFIGMSSGAIQTLNMTGNELLTRRCVISSSIVFIFGLLISYLSDNFEIVMLSSILAWLSQSILSIIYLKKTLGFWGCSLKVD
jgi:hypothetical protein